MKRFSLKRLFVLLGVSARRRRLLPSAPSPAPAPTTTCLATMTTVNTTGDLIVPAGTICHLEFPTVGGNVTVAGTLITNGYTFGKNVTVNGGTLELQNGGTHRRQPEHLEHAGDHRPRRHERGELPTIGGNLTYSNMPSASVTVSPSTPPR